MGIIQTKPILERARPPHPAGRRCPYPGCATILSGYNPGPTCSTHEHTAYAAELVSRMSRRAA